VASLAIVIVALLAVGVVSHTPLRHVIQSAPLALALALTVQRPAWGAWAAAPVLLLWLLVMTLIWLWLTGVARIISGDFPPAEVVLTIVIGAGCACGLPAAILTRPRPAWPVCAGLVLVFAALQFAAAWASILPAIERRSSRPAPLRAPRGVLLEEAGEVSGVHRGVGLAPVAVGVAVPLL
jgi:hypothetical protein